MDNHYPITERIERIASHLRLIAGLLQDIVDMKAVDRANLALVMQYLAIQLEESLRRNDRAILGRTAWTGSASHDGT